MKWYAIHTQSGEESKLKNAIERLIEEREMQSSFGEIIVPEVEIGDKKDGKAKTAKKNLYPGYVFIQMEFSEDALLLIKEVPFSRKPLFVGEKKRFQAAAQKQTFAKPMMISDAEIMKIKKMIENGELSASSSTVYEKGEMILIKDGPFAGFKAVIDDVKDGKEKLEVLVNIFGRSTPVELNFSQVEKVED